MSGASRNGERSRQVNEQGGGRHWGEAPQLLCARGQGAAGEAWERDGAGGSGGPLLPTCWGRGAGAWGPAARLPALFPTLQRSETRPTSASSLSTFPTATFKLSLKTWGAPS